MARTRGSIRWASSASAGGCAGDVSSQELTITAPEESIADVPEALPLLEPADGVPQVMTTVDALELFCAEVAQGVGPVALDAERASGFRYSQRAYLIQVRRRGAGTALIDPIALPDLTDLNSAIGDAEWVLHAATQDLACLAEVGLRPQALFDTELAGRLLGRERVSLAALMASELGWGLEKGHGATDWSVRPLTAAQLRYAALDVELLVELRDALAQDLVAQRKEQIANEEFTWLLDFAPRDRGEDAWRRLSGIHRIRKPRHLAIARELWIERDRIAQQRDVAVGRLLPDSSIVAAAAEAPTSVDQLLSMKDFHGRGADRYRTQWWAAITRAYALEASDWPIAAPPPSGPPAPRTWADRNPQAHATLEAARAALAACAEHMSLPVENLLSPDTVRRLCWEPPVPPDEAQVRSFLQGCGARPWQVEATCSLLVNALSAAPMD